jgi:hypothetical protein
MATILQMVTARQEEFKKNPTRAAQSMSLAIAAVKEGMKSKAWEYYMSQFIDKSNPDLSIDQLARLKATDDTEGDPVMDRHRAYLVANSMCGPSTVETMTIGIESIDDGIATLHFDHQFLDCDTTTFAVAAKGRVSREKKGTKYKKAARG